MISIARTLGPRHRPGRQCRPQHVDRPEPVARARPTTCDVRCMTWLYRSSVSISSTCSDPKSTTRPTSLRARSTSMMCSATSFGCSRARRRFDGPRSSVAPRQRVPAMGREMTVPSRSCTIGSGEHPTSGQLRQTNEVHVRAGIHLAEHPVVVERLGVELEVEPLRQHHLEHVAGQDVLVGHPDRILVACAPHRRARSRRGRGGRRAAVAPRGVRRSSGRRRRPSGPRWRSASSYAASSCSGVSSPAEQHVVDQHDPLTEVIEHRQLTDDGEDRVGVPLVVARGVGQPFDLADDIVAQVPDDAAVERRQSVR